MAPLLKETPSEAVSTLLNRLDAKFTNYSLKNLQQHPDYPSLLAINHTLDQLRIDNVAIKATYEQLQHELPKPLLVHTNENGGTYRVVDNLDEQKISFVDKQGKLRTQPKEAFIKTWSGVTMLVDEQTKGVEKDYALNRIKDFIDQARLPGAVISFLLLVFYIVYFTNNLTTPFDYLFLGTKALGIAATVPLMVRLIDKHNPWAKKLCHSPKAGSKINCADVLDSPAANFLGVFSWSEIGFLYFTVLFSYLLLFSVHSNVLIAGLALLAAPYTIYSIYYQWKVARQWCRLCLAVQAVLLLELVLASAFFGENSFNSISSQSFVALTLVSAIVVTGYSLLKPILLAWKRFEYEYPRLSRIKYSQEVFRLLLEKSPRVDTTGINPIQLRNLEGRHQLTIVSSPTCGPCIKMHHRLFEILNGKEAANLQEIFLTSEVESSDSYQIATCMLALYQETDLITAEKAMFNYYQLGRDHTNFSEWMQKYDRPDLKKNQAKQTLKRHIAWCSERDISRTPIIFYNGHELPPEYTVEDLDYLLD